jgi:hypothetical protein
MDRQQASWKKNEAAGDALVSKKRSHYEGAGEIAPGLSMGAQSEPTLLLTVYNISSIDLNDGRQG